MRKVLRKTLATVLTGALLAGLLVPGGIRTAQAATSDNAIAMSLLKHDSRQPIFRTPFGAVPTDTPVTLRFQTAHADVQKVQLRVWNSAAGAERIYDAKFAGNAINPDGADVDLWEVTVQSSQPTQLWYRWIVKDGTATAYYADDARRDGGLGEATSDMVDNSYSILVYNKNFTTPDWLKNATIYQIFPDRFRNGSTTNDPKPGDIAFGTDPVERRTWTQNPDNPNNKDLPGYDGDGVWSNDFYGGDIAGVMEKLDYLQSLGVNVIYFNPIFAAGSNHRYDTSDYKQVDRYVGTNAEFQQLVAAAEAKGIRVVLDGVFNHTGSDSIYMDRYSKYPTVGAYESQSSPFYSWYDFSKGWPNGYDSWWGYDSLPNLAENDSVKNYIYRDNDAVARYWLNNGAAGWRLDVYPEVSQPFWREFRTAIKETKPDSVMIGEVWDNAAKHFLGDELDSTMNYRFRGALLQFLAGGVGLDKGNPITKIDAATMDSLLQSIREDYPQEVFYSLMNLVDSHDTNRALDALGYDAAAEAAGDAAKLANAKARLRLMAALQFTYPGAPTTYYGDEAGLPGGNDPDDRRTYPWADQGGSPDNNLVSYYQSLGQLRKNNPVLRTGDLTTLYAEGNQYAYGRRLGNAVALTVLNADESATTVTLNLAGYVPDGARFTDKLSGTAYVVAGGQLNVSLDALTAAVLVADAGQSLAPLAAPQHLQATGATNRVALTWDAVDGATGYEVYRSTVDGWYERIATTTDATFDDTTVSNGVKYFYTVAALNGTTPGTKSASVAIMPAVQIGWGNLQWPFSIRHVLQANTPTENIYGKVWVDGITNQPGQGAGIIAQVGYGPQETDPATWTTWTNATFNVDNGNDDEYKATLLPTKTGTFHYTYRYSGDGVNWYYATERGVMEVVQSDDTVPPAAPTGLAAQSSQAKIRLDWTAPADTDLYEYWIYRSATAGQYGEEPVAKVPYTATTYTDEGLDTTATYYYVVKAVDTALNLSPASDEVSGLPVAKQVAVTFQVQVPAYTPQDYPVYVAGSFPGTEWNPGGLQLTDKGNGLWETTLNLVEGTTLEYKYARGSWDRVEKDAYGNEIANRPLTVAYGANGTQFLSDTVVRWRDLPLVVTAPANDAVVTSAQVSVTGNAYTNAGVTVNDAAVTQDGNGNFATTVDLGWHANTITVKTSGQGDLAKTATLKVYRSAGTIGWAGLQWPFATTTKVGTPTETIYGDIWMDGVTTTPDQAPGIKAQLGYGPVDSQPSTWTTWQETTYNPGATGSNDEYMASITPTAAGTYSYTYRFTTDGKDWYYSDKLGTLTVAPSDDQTPPAAPTALAAVAADGKVSLSWTAPADTDLKEYWIYRGTVSGEYGTDPIAKVAATDSTYADGNVVDGTTYYYVVKAVDTSLNASEASNEASVTAHARAVAVTVRVQAPAYTPAGAPVYVVGSFPDHNWVADGIALTDKGNGLWETTLTLPEGASVEYKYTRGSWETVEKNAWADEVQNRRFTATYGSNGTQTISDTVDRWRDLPLVVTAPADNSTTGAAQVTVTGNAYIGAGVKVNDVDVAQDDAGNFATEVALAPGANTITVTTGGAGELAKTVTLTVTRTLSSDATLRSLTLSEGTLKPAFRPATPAYTVSVAAGVATLALTAVTADEGATMRLNDQPVVSGEPTAVTLNVGLNTFNLVVTASDGTATKTYTVKVTRATSSRLASLTLSAGDLQFKPSVTEYSTVVPNSVETIDVTATTAIPTASLWINGVAQASGQAKSIALNVGRNLIKVRVRDGQTTTEYVIQVVRSLPANAYLDAITLSQGELSPAFDAATTVYTAMVSPETERVEVKAPAADPVADVKINNSTVRSGQGKMISLTPGPNTVTIVVTAQNRVRKTYTLTIVRPSSRLSRLTVNRVGLTPKFSPSVTEYAVTVANNVTSVDVTATTAERTATMTMNGSVQASGTAQRINLNVGENVVTMVVTGSDGTPTTYTVTITRKESSNNFLSGLMLTADGSKARLIPGFSPSNTSYRTTIGKAVTSLTLTATTADAEATMTVNGQPVASGDAFAVVLAPGTNTVTIVVTAADGSTRTYKVTVYRGAR